MYNIIIIWIFFFRLVIINSQTPFATVNKDRIDWHEGQRCIPQTICRTSCPLSSQTDGGCLTMGPNGNIMVMTQTSDWHNWNCGNLIVKPWEPIDPGLIVLRPGRQKGACVLARCPKGTCEGLGSMVLVGVDGEISGLPLKVDFITLGNIHGYPWVLMLISWWLYFTIAIRSWLII